MYTHTYMHMFYTLENQSLMNNTIEQLKEHKDGDDKTSVIEFVIGDIVQVIGGELRYVYL
jgi:hypothetical protein